MIFKQYEAILRGDKTMTRRVESENDHAWICGEVTKQSRLGVGYLCYSSVHAENGRIKWAREKQYAIVPKRGQCQLWHKFESGKLLHSLQLLPSTNVSRMEAAQTIGKNYEGGLGWREILTTFEYQPSRIEVTSLHREHLHDIREVDARLEGVGSVDEYRELWESINGKTKYRWSANPSVYVIQFKMVGGSLKDYLKTHSQKDADHD